MPDLGEKPHQRQRIHVIKFWSRYYGRVDRVTLRGNVKRRRNSLGVKATSSGGNPEARKVWDLPSLPQAQSPAMAAVNTTCY